MPSLKNYKIISTCLQQNLGIIFCQQPIFQMKHLSRKFVFFREVYSLGKLSQNIFSLEILVTCGKLSSKASSKYHFS